MVGLARRKVWVWLNVALLLVALAGCRLTANRLLPTAAPPATPSGSGVPRNDNVEALNAAKAAVGNLEFGLAPLLLDKASTITLTTQAGQPRAQLTYPLQPANPQDWPAVDSFVLSVAARQAVLNSPQVSWVALGRFGVSTSVDGVPETVQHTAAWITFVDGSRAVVDFSPLSTNFAPRHIPQEILTDPLEIDKLYEQRRAGVDLTELQPMKVIKSGGQVLYLLAKVEVLSGQYRFGLYLHPVQIADPIRPMELSPGVTAGVDVDRREFGQLQQLLQSAGPNVFGRHPELLRRRGRLDPQLTQALDDNLPLLWHLITKFQAPPTDALLPAPTITPTPPPTTTPTPLPTATPQKLPLFSA